MSQLELFTDTERVALRLQREPAAVCAETLHRIRLSVKDVGQMMFVRAENYFEGELKLKDGLPVSNKEDKRYHGFGMRSMRLIAARYGGTMRVDAEQGLFYLQFVFPFAD